MAVDGGRLVTISAAQLSYLLAGIDWRMPQKTWRPGRRDKLRPIQLRLIFLADFPRQNMAHSARERRLRSASPTSPAPTR